jgi:hypothetical protein
VNDDLVVLTPDEIELLGVALENADEWEDLLTFEKELVLKAARAHHALMAPEEHHAETAGN